MAEKTEEVTIKSDRPVSITLISFFLILGSLLLAWPLFRGSLLQGRGTGEVVYMALVICISIVCGIGLWMMKKWAVYTFTVLLVINQIALLVFGRWNIFTLLFAVIIIFFGYRNLSKMS